MTKPNFIEIVVVLDRSGSMQSVCSDTIGGFNAFVAEQKANALGEVKLSLYQFDDKYDVVYEGKDIKDVPPLTDKTFVPRGMTALLDATGKTINNLGSRLASMPEIERPSLVVFVILTDGQENASKEFKLDQVKEMIKHQTNRYSWQFVFLGADQNAFQAEQLGISSNNTYTYKSVDTTTTYTNLSRSISFVSDIMANQGAFAATASAANLGDLMRNNSATTAAPRDEYRKTLDELIATVKSGDPFVEIGKSVVGKEASQ